MSLVTGQNEIDSLVHSSWNAQAHTAVVLTYSFLTSVDGSQFNADDQKGFVPMSSVQKDAARLALAAWAAVADITFVEVASDGKLQFGTNDQGDVSSGYAYMPSAKAQWATQIFLNNQYPAANLKVAPGQFGFEVLLHEIGHTLGLKHPGNYNAGGDAVDGPFLPSDEDNTAYTVMSYNDSYTAGTMNKRDTTPMLYDIESVQYLYGKNMKTHAGDDVYVFTDNTLPQTIWDAGGVNVMDFSACTGPTVIGMSPGQWSSTSGEFDNIWLAMDVSISKAIGTAFNDEIYTGGVGSTVVAGAGDDLVHAGLGEAHIDGGDGNDTMAYRNTADKFVLLRDGDGWKSDFFGFDYLSNFETIKFDTLSFSLADLAKQIKPTADQVGSVGQALSVHLPGDALGASATTTLAATLANGKALPSWLTFNASTGTLSGTPGAGDAGGINVRITGTAAGQPHLADEFSVMVGTGKASGGNDFFVMAAGDTRIDGLDGRDTMGYSGDRSAFTVKAVDGGFTVTDAQGSTDTLVHVERLQFDDTMLALDIHGIGGEVYRLYQAAFNRTPDAGGLGFWIDQGDKGLALKAMSQYFIDSAEFTAAYGVQTNLQFVNQLYTNVLHRAGEASGVSFYVDLLNAHTIDRAQTLGYFSESNENQAALIGQIENGFTYPLAA